MSTRRLVRVMGFSLAFLASSLRPQSTGFGELHRMLPWAFDFTLAVALGDVDGDGDLDALLGNGGPNRLALNDGAGLFRDASTQLPASSGASESVALGDMDGDGDLDAVMGNDGHDRLYLNDGLGFFVEAAGAIPSILDDTRVVVLFDFDADGDPDIVTGNAGQNRLYLNDGSAVFSNSTASLPAVLDDTWDIALGDVDGDGDVDALIGNNGQSRLYLDFGPGGIVDATSQLPTLPNNTLAVDLGDVDGDGDLDALLGTGGLLFGAQNRLYLNNGVGVFADATAQLPAVLDDTNEVAFLDADLDGDLDALIANGSLVFGGQNRLLSNDGMGNFTDAPGALPAVSDGTHALALGDVDGDADADLWLGNFGQDRLYLSTGSGGFVNVTAPLPAIVDLTQAIALGDVDGDGDLDALIGNASGVFPPVNRLYLNDGTGFFGDATPQLPGNLDGTQAVALGDVDGDGDLDAFLGNGGFVGIQNRLYLNDGSGVFSDATSQLPAILDNTYAVSLGDVDGDLDLDAVIGNVGPEGLYLNDGSGVFTDATTQLPATLDETHALALGDVDGDGDLDALTGNSGLCGLFGCTGEQNRLYLNDGTGIFSDATSQLPAILDGTQAVALEDVDGDGDLDAFIGNSPPFPMSVGQDFLYLNDGSGIFVDASVQLPAIQDDTRAAAFGDVDEDGDPDVFVGNAGQDRLYLNDGAGTFTDAAASLPATLDATEAVALGDVDGDGDLDVVIGNSPQEDRLLSNLTRQLAWRGIPRVGKPLSLDLYGPSGGAWILGLSLGSANVPMPPFGTLRLDPAGIQQAFASLLDAQGRASITYAVPANPVLIGGTVYWQAIVASPARFTNLEISTLTSL